MNILLLYPEFPDTFWSFRHALKFIHKKSPSPPLGLITIAAMLPKEWQIKLVDLNIEPLRDEDLQWADAALVSAMAVQHVSAQQVIGRVKKIGCTIIAGGPLFTYEYKSFPDVDHFVLNEGELTIPPFLKDFKEGRAKKIYQTSEYADMTQTPPPMWELLNLKSYGSMGVQFSRGCPFQCDFCNVTAMLGHKIRIKTTAQIIAELDSLYANNWRSSVFFVDDNFIGNKSYLKNDLLPALIKWRQDKPRITFFTETSINIADDEKLMTLMTEAGFDTVFIGIETPAELSLHECSKKQNQNRNMLEDVKKIQRMGLQVQGGFIIGFDNDSPEIFKQQIDFIQESGIVTAMVGLLQALPGTKLYDRLKKEDRLLGEMSTGNNVASDTNILPAMGLDTLRDGYRKVLFHIYSPKYFYQRIRTFLLEYKPREIKTEMSFQHKMAFFRAVFHLGILGRERFQFWRLLWWAQLHRPALLPSAVTLAIYGHHFWKICRTRIM